MIRAERKDFNSNEDNLFFEDEGLVNKDKVFGLE